MTSGRDVLGEIDKLLNDLILKTDMPPLAEKLDDEWSVTEKKEAVRVMVSGCFDLLHAGHCKFLEEAAAMGDELYVRIGSDSNIRLLKKHEPFLSQTERLYILRSLRSVFDARVSMGTGVLDFIPDLDDIRPHIFFVNADGHREAKRRAVESRGIEYHVAKRVPKKGLPMRSSTELKKALHFDDTVKHKQSADHRRDDAKKTEDATKTDDISRKSESKTEESDTISEDEVDEFAFPWRLCLAGGWLDQPWVSALCPGPVVTVNVCHKPQFADRCGLATSTRKCARKLWAHSFDFSSHKTESTAAVSTKKKKKKKTAMTSDSAVVSIDSESSDLIKTKRVVKAVMRRTGAFRKTVDCTDSTIDITARKKRWFDFELNEEMAYNLFVAENPLGSEYVSGSQDHIGLLFPGINRLQYAGDYWPAAIRTVVDAGICQWLEAHLWLVACKPRPPGFQSLKCKNVTPEVVSKLATAGQCAWNALMQKDCSQLGEALTQTMVCWKQMLPETVPDYLDDFWRKYEALCEGVLFTGAGGGFLMCVTRTGETVPGGFRVEVNTNDWWVPKE